MSKNILEIKNLRVLFRLEEGTIYAVNDISLSIPRGKIVALVGESGSGKSVTGLSILRLIQRPGEITSGEILLNGRDGTNVDIVRLSEKDGRMCAIRGNRISMIFQEPMTALSPVHTIGNQLCEVLFLHRKMRKNEAKKKVVEMLDKVGFPAPERSLRQYPFELSGGMRQRVIIAMAMLAEPELLIADEPTTALDVTIQAQILALMHKLQREVGNSVLLITHDLGVVAQVADTVAVMYLGRIVEKGPMRDIMQSPLHPYTQGLLQSLPSLHLKHERLPSIKGTVPSLNEMPGGCPFHPRCPMYKPGLCDSQVVPALENFGPQREAACFRINELLGVPA
ncbi:MAG: ABC transporter ATP-binding protein [Candidatus Electrothrix sp. ATG2]|nr:ABC transporter ATP-binding protein [Candidatus Electrothrix sp. ATG2]